MMVAPAAMIAHAIVLIIGLEIGSAIIIAWLVLSLIDWLLDRGDHAG